MSDVIVLTVVEPTVVISESQGPQGIQGDAVTMVVAAANPTTSDIPNGFIRMWKNTTDTTLKLYANDGGTLKSILLV